MPIANERIERKARALKQLDPKQEVELEGTFTNHVAAAIRASSPSELQQEIDNATEVYEAALDDALYEILDKHFTAEDSSVAWRHLTALRQPWVGPITEPPVHYPPLIGPGQ
jgi:glucose-6-phosphate 1-dehydrogenase